MLLAPAPRRRLRYGGAGSLRDILNEARASAKAENSTAFSIFLVFREKQTYTKCFS